MIDHRNYAHSFSSCKSNIYSGDNTVKKRTRGQNAKIFLFFDFRQAHLPLSPTPSRAIDFGNVSDLRPRDTTIDMTVV